MRPFLKTWLTICLFMPLAAHATNREQPLPPSFTGFTANSHPSPTSVASKKVTQEALEETAMPLETSGKKSRTTKGKKAQAGSHKISQHTVALATTGQMGTKQSSNVVNRAVKAIGTPYRWGGTSPTKGFDCSGLVKYAFNDVSEVDLPRTSNAMSEGHGQKVDRKDLKPGDLLFFNIKSRQVNHVAIYLGDDRFVHAPRRGKAVTIDTLKKPYWDSHYVVAKRVLPKQPPSKKGTVRIAQR
ncbi:C40 family peptidase [Pseudomonas sp. SLFW]|jgi:chitinase|uniref:C40 family peptidase n=1 Tax=Pseudomonas TaxID=286 RepID=UPI00141318F2|nr:C40 family peptidase [Pseudomonas sp. SLFW]NBB10598.1 peptidoglycan endopeptidase [Pseudomonas sp. SLFW]